MLRSHPVDNFFVNMLPFGLSVKLFRMHGEARSHTACTFVPSASSCADRFGWMLLLCRSAYTYWMALFIVVLVGVDDHSGYSFPCSPFRLFPFVVDAVGLRRFLLLCLLS